MMTVFPLAALVVIGDGGGCGVGAAGGELHAQFLIRWYSAAFLRPEQQLHI